MQDNQVVYTCWSILNCEEDICHIFHDEDGNWQFLGMNRVDIKTAAIVSLRNILDCDSSLEELLNMAVNSVAFRENKNQHWVVSNAG